MDIPTRISRRGLLIIAVLFLALIALGVTALQFRDAFTDILAASHVPNELKQAYFIGETSTPLAVYRVVPLGFKKQSSIDAPLPATASPDDPNLTVYASRASKVPVPLASTKIYIREGTKEGQPIATGYGPAFLDGTHVSYFAEDGIYVYDRNAATSTRISSFPAHAGLDSVVSYSPDRSMVIWTDSVGKRTYLARITPTSYTVLHDFAALPGPVLTNTSLYWVQSGKLWQSSLDGTERMLLAFPAHLSIIRVFI